MARVAAKSSTATHEQICKQLTRNFEGDPGLHGLSQFLRLADAGMELMDHVMLQLNGNASVPLADVIRAPDTAECCRQLIDAAKLWNAEKKLENSGPSSASRFANAIPERGAGEVLRALLHFHELHGGGNRWFVLRNGKLEVRTPSSRASSRYGFRLQQLCRTAEQCGVIKSLPTSLRHAGFYLADDNGEASDD